MPVADGEGVGVMKISWPSYGRSWDRSIRRIGLSIKSDSALNLI